MSIPRVNNFLNSFSLKCGAITAAWSESTASLIIFMTSAITFFDTLSIQGSIDWFGVVYMILSLMHLLYSVVFTIGVHKKCLKYIRVWIYFGVVSMGVYPIIIVVHVSKIFIDNQITEGVAMLLLSCILFLAHLYLVVVVRSYLEECVYGNIQNLA